MHNKAWCLILLIGTVLVSGCVSGNVVAEEPKLLEFKKPIVIDEVSITFDSISFADKINYYSADDGYKFAVIYISAKNIGYERKFFPLDFYDMKMTVNSGYKYEYHTASEPLFSIRPGDSKTGYVVFEILKETYPTELYLENDIHSEHCLEMLSAPHYEYVYECVEKSILPISRKDYECTDNSDCSHGSICVNKKCTKAECMTNSYCPYYKPACANNKCVECNTNSECIFPPACYNHKCVECNTNSDCESYFEPACYNHECVECNTNSDCHHSSKSTCHNHKCVECNTNSDCIYSAVCYDHNCVECNTDSECSDSIKPVCYKNRCIECIKNSDCPSKKPICNRKYDQNYCVECLISSDCKDPKKTFCYSISYQCVECLKNTDCPDESNSCVAGKCY